MYTDTLLLALRNIMQYVPIAIDKKLSFAVCITVDTVITSSVYCNVCQYIAIDKKLSFNLIM